MSTDIESRDALSELLSTVRMLAAAFPLSSWNQASEAVYVMALADEDVTPDEARTAVRRLIRGVDKMPTVHLLLTYCRDARHEAERENDPFPPRISAEEREKVREMAARCVKRMAREP